MSSLSLALDFARSIFDHLTSFLINEGQNYSKIGLKNEKIFENPEEQSKSKEPPSIIAGLQTVRRRSRALRGELVHK